jgi:GGDEF domain-containing protein
LASTVDKNSSRIMELGTESHQRFLERTQLEISRAERYCLFLSLIMVDLSEFARAMVNRQGQLKVDLDTVCSQIEAGLRNSLRLSDVISTFEKNRLGILLVETSKANVDNVRKRIEVFVRDYLKGGLGLPFEPPLEVRTASYPEESDRFSALTSLLNRVQQHMK